MCTAGSAARSSGAKAPGFGEAATGLRHEARMSFAGRSSALVVRRRVRRCMGHWKPGGHPSARGAAYPGCATDVCSAALQAAGYIAVTSQRRGRDRHGPRRGGFRACHRTRRGRGFRVTTSPVRTLSAPKTRCLRCSRSRTFAPVRAKLPAKERISRISCSFALVLSTGDGGNRTHVRDRVKVASTSVAGALISSSTRLAGGVVADQPAG